MNNYISSGPSPERDDDPIDRGVVSTDADDQTLVEDALYGKWILSSEELLLVDAPRSLRNVNAKFDQLADYVEFGWSIVPQLPGKKSPCVKWKPYQTVRPSEDQLFRWFSRWRDAGPTVVLGPLSNLYAIDVDGREAHDELVRRLGKVPSAPMVKSGSGRPYRYHLYFTCPPITTSAKFTPWHPKLEFRGQGGIIVLPPALHKSGRCYQWAPRKSLKDVPLPPLPDGIVAALRERKPRQYASLAIAPQSGLSVRVVPGVSHRTREFLGGSFAHADGWNSRLFGAACDMAGNGVPLEMALPLLIAGAQPWDAAEEARAFATVQSAYSQPRMPARSRQAT